MITTDVLTIIAYHNGSQYLGGLLPLLKPPYVVVDTGSTASEMAYLCAFRPQYLLSLPGGYCTEAYRYAYESMQAEAYFFMHDSMRIKEPDFLNHFRSRGPVVAWIGFHGVDYGLPGSHEEAWLTRLYGPPIDLPNVGIFGPIFYADREAIRAVIERGLWPPPLQNRHELVAAERGLAIAFHRAGYEVAYLEEYDNERIDQVRDYKFFDKFRPNRE